MLLSVGGGEHPFKTMSWNHRGESEDKKMGGWSQLFPSVGEAGTGRVIKSSMTYFGFGAEVMSQPVGSLPWEQIGKTLVLPWLSYSCPRGPNPAPCVLSLIKSCLLSPSWAFWFQTGQKEWYIYTGHDRKVCKNFVPPWPHTFQRFLQATWSQISSRCSPAQVPTLDPGPFAILCLVAVWFFLSLPLLWVKFLRSRSSYMVYHHFWLRESLMKDE